MKKRKGLSRGRRRPISIFPHEARRRVILAFLCIWRHRRQDQPMLALVPRDVVRMICGWVRADFRGVFWDGRTNWTLWQAGQVPKYSFLDRDRCRFIWKMGKINCFYAACPVCLSFLRDSFDCTQESWECWHQDDEIPLDHEANLQRLRRKYILPNNETN